MPAALLVVEDDPSVANITCRILEEAGYRCTWLASGGEAIARFEGEQPDVDALVLDIRLPDISGLEVARRVRLRRPGIPIVFVSGYPEHHGEDLPASPWTFLAKPFRQDQLLDNLRELLEQASTPSPPPA